MDIGAFVFISISVFLVLAVILIAIKKYNRPSIGTSLFILVLLGAILSLSLKYYTISNAIFFPIITIIFLIFLIGGIIQITKLQKDNWKFIGLFIIISPLWLVGYLVLVSPLFFPADINIENPLKINPDSTASFNFIFTHHQYNIMKFFPNSKNSLLIEDNNFSIYSDPIGLQRALHAGFFNLFTMDKKYIKGSIFSLSPQLINSNSFDVLVNYTEGSDGPIFVDRKAKFQCNKINPDAKLISEILFDCVKK